MTTMTIQKQKLLRESIRNIKALRHLTGNNQDVAQVQAALEDLKEVI